MKPFVTRSISVASIAGVAFVVALASGAQARTMPTEQVRGGVHFVSGGIGTDESAAMQRAASRYALELIFAQRDGNRGDYLAYVPVTIRDSSGHAVLSTRTRGPYLLANLPGGTYSVTATEHGVAKQQVVHLAPGGHQSMVFEW